MTSSFKKTKKKKELLTDINILLMVEKIIRGRICHSFCQYTKSNNTFVKDYDKNRIVISSILGYVVLYWLVIFVVCMLTVFLFVCAIVHDTLYLCLYFCVQATQ